MELNVLFCYYYYYHFKKKNCGELLKLLNDSIMILDRENLSHSCTQCWSVN